MSEQERGPGQSGRGRWFLPIFDLHPSAAVLLLFFFYVGVATFTSEIPVWFSTGQMPRPGAYWGGLIFAAALVHFGKKWRQEDKQKGR